MALTGPLRFRRALPMLVFLATATPSVLSSPQFSAKVPCTTTGNMTISLCCQALDSPNDPRFRPVFGPILLANGIIVPVQGTEVILLGVKCVERKFGEEPEECTAQDVCCERALSGEYIFLVANSVYVLTVSTLSSSEHAYILKMALLLSLAYLLLLRRKRRDRTCYIHVRTSTEY